MAWDVERTDEFAAWVKDLTEKQFAAIDLAVDGLIEKGPSLGFPQSSGIEGSKHDHMRELRIQIGGAPFRIFYAFDPLRHAILLIGGDKTGDKRFYKRMIPVADKLYDDHIQELKDEGKLK